MHRGAIAPVENRADLGRVKNQQENNRAIGCKRSGGRMNDKAQGSRKCFTLRVNVANMNPVPAFTQPLGHRHTHKASANDADR
jgi:hypothetical protein